MTTINRDPQDRRLTRSELLAVALDAAQAGDEDTRAEAQAELMGRFRMTGLQIQSALIRLLTHRRTAGQSTPRPGVVDVATVRQLDHLVPGFIPAKEQTLIYAARGVGKTIAALEISRAVITGQPLLDRSEESQRGRVLYLATDSGCESMATQMQELGLLELPEFQAGHPGQSFFIRGHNAQQGITAWEATIQEILWLLRFVQENQIDLVVIDSAKACLSLTDIEYTDNTAVVALLTLFQRVICPHTSVCWLQHDGREHGHNAGAKAWSEVPVMVHRIERLEARRGRSAVEEVSLPEEARRWVCVKSRIPGDEREFTYVLNPEGRLEVTAGVEVVGSCREAVVDVLSQAVAMGETNLQTSELIERVMKASSCSSKTVRNTLTQLRRAREVVNPGRGRCALAPRLIERLSLRGCGSNGRTKGEIPVIDKDSPLSRQCPDGTSRDIRECPVRTSEGQLRDIERSQSGEGVSAVLSRNPGKSAHPPGVPEASGHGGAGSEPGPDPSADGSGPARSAPSPRSELPGSGGPNPGPGADGLDPALVDLVLELHSQDPTQSNELMAMELGQRGLCVLPQQIDQIRSTVELPLCPLSGPIYG